MDAQLEEVISVQEEIESSRFIYRLQSLHTQVSSYLQQTDNVTLSKESLERNPFTIEPQLCPDSYREEVIDLKSDSFAKDFWIVLQIHVLYKEIII